MTILNPANELLGKTTITGWTVIEKLEKGPNSSGGNFSVSYLAQKGNERAFLKALNVYRALRLPNFMRELEKLVVAHNYECDILNLCKGHRLSKIVNILEAGEFLPDDSKGETIAVPYIIFEIAEKTARDMVDELDQFNSIWIMHSMHNICVGVKQLHYIGIVHQDLKPSNVLLFDNTKVSKLADFGRAERRDIKSIYVDYSVVGDPTYAPPEALYGVTHSEWNVRRHACDLYHVGSMLCFYFTLEPMTNLIKFYLPNEYYWSNWKGNYQDVLPYLQEAFQSAIGECVKEFQNRGFDEASIQRLVVILQELCEPDPLRRGHPVNLRSNGNRYSIERYINQFDILAKRFQLKGII